MEYYQLPKSDIEISRVTLGTWAIGGAHWGNYDEADAIRAIEVAFAHGINTVDTAPVYGNGHSEKILGQLIKGRRDKIVIASKCGLDMNNNYEKKLTPEFIREDLENSLRRLQTDYIDIYQCHWPDDNTPIEETVEELLKLKKEGKIRYPGLSNHAAKDIQKAIKKAKNFVIQHHYSLLERTIEIEIIKLCTKKHLPILTYGSLAGGMLTGKYTEWKKFKKNDVRYFFYKSFQKRHWDRVSTIVEKVRTLAAAKKVTAANIAISWLLAQEGIASAIVGAKNEAQVMENINSVAVKLNESEIEYLRNIACHTFR